MSDSSLEPAVIVKKERIKFIDIARSIAILLMLEGHYIALTYKNFKPMVEKFNANGTSGNYAFDFWYFLKGFTAPMFFTVTGLVFVYLLAQNDTIKYFKNLRVTKGYRRAFQLLFWGYVLQINLIRITKTFREPHPYIYTYHVLQSIGIGIIFILLIYGLYKMIKVIPLTFYYFFFGTLIFCLYPTIKNLPEQFFPEWVPEIFQNMIKGPRSVFPIVPWMAFTLYGGMLGSLLVKHKEKIKSTYVLVTIAIVGLSLNIAGYAFAMGLDNLAHSLGYHKPQFIHNAWLYGRFGQILIVLSILAAIEKYVKIKDSLFLKIGQNTLPIYVLHVVILYSGIIGIGLDKYISNELSGWLTVISCALFLSLFVVFIYYFEPIMLQWARFKAKVRHTILRIFVPHKTHI